MLLKCFGVENYQGCEKTEHRETAMQSSLMFLPLSQVHEFLLHGLSLWPLKSIPHPPHLLPPHLKVLSCILKVAKQAITKSLTSSYSQRTISPAMDSLPRKHQIEQIRGVPGGRTSPLQLTEVQAHSVFQVSQREPEGPEDSPALG